jgi:hypothetical protein
MTARWTLAVALTALLTGCQSSTPGSPVISPNEPTEPSFPTSRPTRPTAAPPQTLTPGPSRTPTPPGGQVLTPENGYVFIETKSGKTRCQLNTSEVGCETQFTNSPVLDGTLDYAIYSAVGWTIDAGEDGTRFTNDGTGHGMVVAVDGVQAF